MGTALKLSRTELTERVRDEILRVVYQSLLDRFNPDDIRRALESEPALKEMGKVEIGEVEITKHIIVVWFVLNNGNTSVAHAHISELHESGDT